MRNSPAGEVIQRPKAAKRVERNLDGAIGATQKKAAVDDRGYRYYSNSPLGQRSLQYHLYLTEQP
jgi:hypothetical protein